ncbi:MAG: hypothetical protein MMC33_004576 [Icmadophila ericetorum]|nr:hypothetical protein [Icmadophila ericetorum]
MSMLSDILQPALDSTTPPPPPPSFSPNSNPNFRTPSSLYLRTFALRIAVFTAYGHLGTLQNLTGTATISIPRLVILLVFPGATLIQMVWNYLAAIYIYLFRVHKKWESESIKYTAMIAAGLCVPDQDSEERTYTPIAFRDIPLSRLIHRPTVRTRSQFWDSFTLATGRALNLLAVLAQTSAAFLLIYRRSHIQDATLLLDSTNGLYAFIGILTTFNSLLILFVGGKW